jgi:acyl carrier protein
MGDVTVSELDAVREVVASTIGIEERAATLAADTPLLGSIPELDSLGAVEVLVALEERFGIVVEDDEVDAEIFATLGALTAFVERKLD